MPFTHTRTIRLADTDAAGVVFFARTLMLCHEAYEESLARAGIDLKQFLGVADLIVPISKCEADYLRPLYCGDKVKISVTPSALTSSSFAIAFEITKLGPPDKVAARVRTEHVATSLKKRARVDLSPALAAWIAGK
ncbi:MAG: thioesterase superfamily protein [Verrucomicrobia bacterium]|nr:thioesterase superfamily protein [Verrucomicrobiota bacterium]